MKYVFQQNLVLIHIRPILSHSNRYRKRVLHRLTTTKPIHYPATKVAVLGVGLWYRDNTSISRSF